MRMTFVMPQRFWLNADTRRKFAVDAEPAVSVASLRMSSAGKCASVSRDSPNALPPSAIFSSARLRFLVNSNFALSRPLIAVASAAWQVVGFRIIDRLGQGIRTPPRDALIAEVSDPGLRGRSFGFHRGADHFGAVLGSLAAWWLLEHGADVRSVIQWSVVPGVVAFLVLAVVLKTGDRGSGTGDQELVRRQRPAHSSFPASLVPGPSLWPPLFALTALTLFRLPETLLILRIQDLGVSIAAVPLIWAGLHVVRSASSYPGGRLADRRGAAPVVAAGGLLFAAVAVALGLTVEPAAAVALFLVFGLVAGLTESGERSLVARLAPVRTGRAFGAYHALTGFAALPAGLLFGGLYQSLGARAALWASSAGMLVAVLLWLGVSLGRESRTA